MAFGKVTNGHVGSRAYGSWSSSSYIPIAKRVWRDVFRLDSPFRGDSPVAAHQDDYESVDATSVVLVFMVHVVPTIAAVKYYNSLGLCLLICVDFSESLLLQ